MINTSLKRPTIWPALLIPKARVAVAPGTSKVVKVAPSFTKPCALKGVPPKRRLAWLADPPDSLEFPDSKRIFEAHMSEHPLITHYHRTHDGRALKISDFLTQRQLHHLGLYNEFYRRLGVEHQMAVTLPAPRPLVIGIALNRGRRDFSERERLCLNLLRPHLIQAYYNAAAVAGLQQALDELAQGVVVLARDGRVVMANGRARQWVAEYFEVPGWGADRLPDALQRWVSQQEARLAAREDAPPPRQPLVVARQGKRLVVRLLTEAGRSTLLFAEEQTVLQPAVLAPFGLTRREAEVLFWMAEGKTNGEISTILGVSVRTVQKHVEHILTKLGMETRTAAAAWTHQVAGAGRGAGAFQG